jgi:putative tricarboxylic transport membrane protein
VQRNLRDIAAGLLFLAIGLHFALGAWLSLRMGTALQMGPGYFPLVLGALLSALGIAIIVVALRSAAVKIDAVSWRGVALVTASIIFFAATIRGLGVAFGLGGAVLLASLSTEKNSFLQSAIIAAVFTTASIIVFVWLLGIPLPVIGPWLRLG